MFSPKCLRPFSPQVDLKAGVRIDSLYRQETSKATPFHLPTNFTPHTWRENIFS